jgi:hypothetical protein
MLLKMYFLSLLLIGTCVSAVTFPDFTKSEISSFNNMVNRERASKNIAPVSINWNLTYALQQFISVEGADWGYEDTDILPNIFNHYTKFHVLKTNTTFMNIAKKYHDLPKALKESYLDAVHDTFVDQGGKNRALQIVRFRLNQRSCFDHTKCFSNFTNYESCSGKYPVINHQVRSPCQWFYWYYPRIIHPKVKQVAFVKLQRPGRFVVQKQQNNAWLIVFVMPNFTDFKTDFVY